MADDKKNIPKVDAPGETVAPTAETPAPDPALTDQEAVTLEQEGLAALFETGEAVPNPGEQPKPIEPEKTVLLEQPKTEKKQPTPGKDDPAPERSGKVVDFAAARNEAEKTLKEKKGKQKAADKDKSEKTGRGRPPKEGKDKQSSKSPKASLLLKILSQSRRKRLLLRNHPPSLLLPGMPAVAKRRRSSVSTCPNCIRSKIIPLVFGTMRKCRDLWSRSRPAV